MLSKWFIFVYKVWVDYISLNLRKKQIVTKEFYTSPLKPACEYFCVSVLNDKILLFFVNVLVQLHCNLRSVTTSLLSL